MLAIAAQFWDKRTWLNAGKVLHYVVRQVRQRIAGIRINCHQIKQTEEAHPAYVRVYLYAGMHENQNNYCHVVSSSTFTFPGRYVSCAV